MGVFGRVCVITYADNLDRVDRTPGNILTVRTKKILKYNDDDGYRSRFQNPHKYGLGPRSAGIRKPQ